MTKGFVAQKLRDRLVHVGVQVNSGDINGGDNNVVVWSKGHIDVEFNWQDFQTTNKKLIGTIPMNSKVFRCVIEIYEPFDEPSTFVVGTAEMPGVLMLNYESDPYYAGRGYVSAPEHEVTVNTEAFILSEYSQLTKGRGKVTIYFN